MVGRGWADTVGGSFQRRSFRTWRIEGSSISRTCCLQIGMVSCHTNLSVGEMVAPRMTMIIIPDAERRIMESAF